MTPHRLLLAIVAIAGLIVALVIWRSSGGDDVPGPIASAPAASPTASRPTHTGPTASRLRPGGRRLDATQRAVLLARLEQARKHRAAAAVEAVAPSAPAGAAGPPPELPVPVLDKAYIQDRIRELVPMIKECYQQALADQPGLSGTIVVEFEIGAEPEIGGLVETSEVLENSTITHAGMSECVRETMYGAEFVAPADGGKVTVRYPFTFASAP